MQIRVCFVCAGNICRSPTAEGIFLELLRQRGLAAHFEIDSAGTGAGQAGAPADARSQQTAQTRGISLSSRARRFDRNDFGRFDYLLAMDGSNLLDLIVREHGLTPQS